MLIEKKRNKEDQIAKDKDKKAKLDKLIKRIEEMKKELKKAKQQGDNNLGKSGDRIEGRD